MEETTEQAKPSEIEQQLAALAPLAIIRTETVLSRLPIHNLAKKGKVDISITRRNNRGELELRWEVSYSDRYGQPRQLGYKVDTIVVNRRIDEIGRPLPQVIRLGSLREIAQELSFGSDTNSIRNALLQNASSFINAKLDYYTNDGYHQTLETGFSRYGVVFTGQKLPDGRKADAVYLTLNAPYWEVLNNAPVRPLNYDYLRQLPPAPQRFYEIVSRRIFAALKYQHAEAKLLYSEYCTYSAQQRYFNYDQFKKQMYKIHRPHLTSGYLKTVRYQDTTDMKGQPDWIMYYVPGPKARVEYGAFTRSGRVIEMTADMVGEELELSTRPPPQPRRSGPRQRNFQFNVAATPQAVPHPALAELTQRGISGSRACQLLATATKPELIIDQLEWGDEQIRRARPGEIRNPAGFYIHLVKENIQPPPGFETSRRRKLREEAFQAEQQEVYQRFQQEEAYQRYRTEAVEQFISDQHLEEECQILARSAMRDIRTQWRNAPAHVLAELADRKAREIIAERIPTLLTLEAFCQTEQGQRATTAAS
jgi:hypothetical protein